jgi:hypothetical protein
MPKSPSASEDSYTDREDRSARNGGASLADVRWVRAIGWFLLGYFAVGLVALAVLNNIAVPVAIAGGIATVIWRAKKREPVRESN